MYPPTRVMCQAELGSPPRLNIFHEGVFNPIGAWNLTESFDLAQDRESLDLAQDREPAERPLAHVVVRGGSQIYRLIWVLRLK
jgi:hypothetical protein